MIGWAKSLPESLIKRENNRVEPVLDPLCLASRTGHENIVKFLLEEGMNPNDLGYKNLSPLSEAIINGHNGIAQMLIDRGADVNLPNYDFYIQKPEQGETAIKFAIEKGNLEGVKLLVKNGADMDLRELMYSAIISENTDMVKYLMDKGADITDTLNWLHLTNETSQNMVMFLIENGAKLDVKEEHSYGHTPLQRAVMDNHIELAETLLKAGANVNLPNFSDETPLILAIWNKDLHMAKLLIANGADLNYEDCNGFTPLTAAIETKDKAMLRFLIESGADINKISFSGRGEPPIEFAAQNGNLFAVRTLMESGAYIKNADKIIHLLKKSVKELSVELKTYGSISKSKQVCDIGDR